MILTYLTLTSKRMISVMLWRFDGVIIFLLFSLNQYGLTVIKSFCFLQLPHLMHNTALYALRNGNLKTQITIRPQYVPQRTCTNYSKRKQTTVPRLF